MLITVFSSSGLSRVAGSSNFGILDVPLPEQSIFMSQILYGSIGWSVGEGVERTICASCGVTLRFIGGTLGAAFAARDRELGRVILFIGDGSM